MPVHYVLKIWGWLLLALVVHGSTAPPSPGHWVDTWTAMPQLTESTNLPNPPFNTSIGIFQNTTIRTTIHTSIGAEFIRLRISNVFGDTNLPITAVTVALPAGGAAGVSAIQPGSSQKVTFSGQPGFSIPNGALIVSDPLHFPVGAQENIAVTIFTEQGQAGWNISSHPGSRINSFFTFGNFVDANNFTIDDPNDQIVAHWYFISAVEAWVPASSRAFAVVGDSITDGRGSDTNENNRWPDLVLAKMQKNSATSNIAVVNQAAGGNRILADGLGPNALGRIDRDVLAQSGVKYAMIFEGINDIGDADPTPEAQQAIGDQIIFALSQIATRVHTFGIPMFAATITPFNGSLYNDPTGNREATRQRVNTFIKQSKTFDAVIDFDAIVRDPNDPVQLNPAFDSGDFLHPNVSGYEAIANAFPLNIFTQFEDGVPGFT